MTREELKQKAIENVRNRFSICKNRNGDFILDNFGAEVEALVQFAEPREKHIEELEKENAELKETIHKAGEIIRGLYYIVQDRIDYDNNIGIADEMWRAKQFLKDR